ncbi:hypothetical protein ACJ41O_007612 [Fusarium nematophilum]
MSKYAAAHVDPQGPGDARPTGLQIVEDENLIGKLTGKTVFITGANSGLGAETARVLHATGATVFLGVRNLASGQETIDSILASDPSNKAPLHLVEISLDSLASVRKGAESLLSQTSKLNLLILNAGVMATPFGKTVDGFETQFGVNHLGHFLLFQLIKPALLAASTPEFHSRVVALSSTGHRGGEVRFHDFNFDEPDSYDRWLSYGQSKTANIYLANEIERRYGNKGLHGYSLHPGVINTGLGRHMDVDSAKFVQENPHMAKLIKSLGQGVATTVYAALSRDWEGRGGRYFVDCAEGVPQKPESGFLSTDQGYAPWIYDQQKAARLWVESNKLVGLDAEE